MRRSGRLVALTGALVLWVPTAPVLQAQSFETTELADGVYQFRWQGHNSLFITTPAGVVVVDPISSTAARQLALEIRAVAPEAPVAAIVYSHSDADHATGAPALLAAIGQASAPIIAHERAAEPIRQGNDPERPPPTVTFARRMAFAPGGRTIELHYLGPSHTDNMVVPFIPDVGVAFAVDFVFNDRVGWRDLPGWHFPGLFEAIAGLLEIPFEIMAFGHGAPGDRATIQRQLAYYDDLTAAVRRTVARGLTEDEAVAEVRLPTYSEWEEYDTTLGLNVRAIHRWLTAEGD